jgi:hypothetical protein
MVTWWRIAWRSGRAVWLRPGGTSTPLSPLKPMGSRVSHTRCWITIHSGGPARQSPRQEPAQGKRNQDAVVVARRSGPARTSAKRIHPPLGTGAEHGGSGVLRRPSGHSGRDPTPGTLSRRRKSARPPVLLAGCIGSCRAGGLNSEGMVPNCRPSPNRLRIRRWCRRGATPGRRDRPRS